MSSYLVHGSMVIPVGDLLEDEKNFSSLAEDCLVSREKMVLVLLLVRYRRLLARSSTRLSSCKLGLSPISGKIKID